MLSIAYHEHAELLAHAAVGVREDGEVHGGAAHLLDVLDPRHVHVHGVAGDGGNLMTRDRTTAHDAAGRQGQSCEKLEVFRQYKSGFFEL